MVSVVRRVVVRFFLGMAFLGVTSCLFAQGTVPPPPADPAAAKSQAEVPDAPVPQIEIALAADPRTADPQTGQAQNPQQPATNAPAQNTPGQSSSTQQPATGATPPPAASGSAAQSNSSPQNSAPQTNTQETKHQKAEEEIKEQEHQRMAGIIPEFNVSYRSDAVPLTPAEKFKLEFHSAVDPYTFSIAAIVAGIGEAEKSNSGFGWGPEGYGKRVAAAYADNVIGNTLGNAVLPSILHQDPRYYRLGHGTKRHRFFYAVATSFICKHDSTGKWEPNYSNILGNLIGGEISNLYYPDNSKSNIGQTIGNGMTVTAEGAFGATLEEFWPDISRRFFHKDPTHGLDAPAQADDAAAKQKKPQDENQK